MVGPLDVLNIELLNHLSNGDGFEALAESLYNAYHENKDDYLKDLELINESVRDISGLIEVLKDEYTLKA